MRWSLFLVATYLALALQTGLTALWRVDATTPNFLLILVVFVGLSAPLHTVAWAALAAGVLADLGRVVAGHPVWLVGPWCLGFLGAGYAAYQVRGLVFRQSAWAMAATTLFAGLLAYVTQIAVISLRGLPFVPGDPVPLWEGADQLVRGFLELLYTTVWALPLGKLLLWSERHWGFAASPGYRPRRAV